MKQIKLKFFALIVLIATFWSCQTEQFVAESSKPKPIADGIPSPYDDYHRLTTTNYYHMGQKVTDTTIVKKMLLDAKVIAINGDRTDIYATENEAKMVNDEIENAQNGTTSKAGPDGDDFLIYFYEVNWHIKPNYIQLSTLYYGTVRGPVGDYSVKAPSWKIWGYDKNNVKTKLSDYTQYIRTLFTPEYRFVQSHDINYQINVYNPTRYTRTVVFEDQFRSKVTAVIPSRKSVTLYGWTNYAGYAFNGKSFVIKQHYSYRTP
jgi:hypothetical protein